MSADGIVRGYDAPYAVASSESRSYAVYKVADLQKPQGAPFTTQSAVFVGDDVLVFHDDTVIQRYSCGEFVDETTLAEGRLLHPNDSEIAEGELWVCDTGEPTPEIKVVDLLSLRVVRSYRPVSAGWRVAAVSVDGPASFWCAAAQGRPVEERDEILVGRYDREKGELVRAFGVPTDQYYVQGCTVVGRFMFVAVNDGDVALSKILRVDLAEERVVETIVLDDFGETEGLDSHWQDGRIVLTTALRHALFRMPC